MKITNPASTDRIAHAVRSSPMSQREIARALGVSEQSVSSYVSGWRKPSAGTLGRLASVLGVEPRSLINDPAR